MSNDFDRISKWYDRSFNQWYFSRIHNQGLDFLDGYLKPGQKILDIGCGTGNWLLRLKKKYNVDLYGIDESRGMIAVAKNKDPGLKLTVGDAANLPFGSGAFDLVSIIEAFHHFKDQAKTLSEARRVLKSGGYCFLLDPALDGPWKLVWPVSKLLPFERHSKFFRLKDLVLKFEQSGFKILKSRSKFANGWILAQKSGT